MKSMLGRPFSRQASPGFMVQCIGGIFNLQGHLSFGFCRGFPFADPRFHCPLLSNCRSTLSFSLAIFDRPVNGNEKYTIFVKIRMHHFPVEFPSAGTAQWPGWGANKSPRTRPTWIRTAYESVFGSLVFQSDVCASGSCVL